MKKKILLGLLVLSILSANVFAERLVSYYTSSCGVRWKLIIHYEEQMTPADNMMEIWTHVYPLRDAAENACGTSTTLIVL